MVVLTAVYWAVRWVEKRVAMTADSAVCLVVSRVVQSVRR
jgi:hypothetical protein